MWCSVSYDYLNNFEHFLKTGQSDMVFPTQNYSGDNFIGIIIWIMQLYINWFHTDKNKNPVIIIIFRGYLI